MKYKKRISAKALAPKKEMINKTLPEKVIKNIYAMYMSGIPVNEISKRVHVNEKKIYNVIHNGCDEYDLAPLAIQIKELIKDNVSRSLMKNFKRTDKVQKMLFKRINKRIAACDKLDDEDTYNSMSDYEKTRTLILAQEPSYKDLKDIVELQLKTVQLAHLVFKDDSPLVQINNVNAINEYEQNLISATPTGRRALENKMTEIRSLNQSWEDMMLSTKALADFERKRIEDKNKNKEVVIEGEFEEVKAG